MALPKINSSPEYTLKIPSNSQEITYRPYLVKEERILLMALESQDPKHMYNAIVNTLSSCIKEDINIHSLTIFDVEYIFIQLRSKSTGDLIKLKPACESCSHEQMVAIKIDEVKVDMPALKDEVKLTDKVTLKMKWPTYYDMINEIGDGTDKSQTSMAFKMINKCIRNIMTEDENISVTDVEPKEVEDFIGDLNSDQFTKLREYIEQMPRLKHELKWNCESCSTTNSRLLQGMNDFF